MAIYKGAPRFLLTYHGGPGTLRRSILPCELRGEGPGIDGLVCVVASGRGRGHGCQCRGQLRRRRGVQRPHAKRRHLRADISIRFMGLIQLWSKGTESAGAFIGQRQLVVKSLIRWSIYKFGTYEEI
jgi:hypothetical protein